MNRIRVRAGHSHARILGPRDLLLWNSKALLIRREQRFRPALRQRCRQQNNRRTKAGGPGQEPLQQTPHVGVVGMHFINDQRLAGKAEEPYKEMAAPENSHQALIDRAHPVRSQKSPLGLRKPVAGNHGRLFFVEAAHTGEPEVLAAEAP
jgi:hypothetical protein